MVKPLAKTVITPNQVTIFSLFLALLASFLISIGDPLLLNLGAREAIAIYFFSSGVFTIICYHIFQRVCVRVLNNFVYPSSILNEKILHTMRLNIIQM